MGQLRGHYAPESSTGCILLGPLPVGGELFCSPYVLLRSALPALTTAAMLRLLRLEVLQLPATSPYREARLRRLTDQFTYIVQTWAGLPWPTTSRQGDEVPSQAQVLHQLTHLPTEPGDQQKALLVLALLLT